MASEGAGSSRVESAPAGVKVGWGVAGILATAQFIMVLDTTVMNVSITQVVADLDTTVVGLQTAITMYTLVMAAFMLIGGKIGDRWGAKRAFWIGLLVYGTGSLTTALSPNLAVLLVGWSLVEGLGAVLVIPAIAALTAATYQGKQRAIAYGILGGVSGASMAAGPLIGGWVTANLSWRYVFAGETVVVLILMLFLKLIPATVGRKSKLDVGGAVLSAAGLGAVVFGVLKTSQWGWVTAKAAAPVAPLGLSPSLWLIAIGSVLLWLFVRQERRVKEGGQEPLLDLALPQIPRMRAGLVVQWCQAFIIQGTFFVLPLYLQTVLGFDALKTGKTILPMSIAMFVFALGGSALTGRYSPKLIVQRGIAAMLVGEAVLLHFIGPELNGWGFGIGLALLGAGLGLLASQVGNVIMSSVDPSRGGEAGGLQGTSLNLGASLGVALVGSILIASLATNFSTEVMASSKLPDRVKQQVAAAAETSANFASTEQVEQAAEDAGLSRRQTNEIVAVYSDSQLKALRAALGFLALFALLALAWVRRLPEHADPPRTTRASAPDTPRIPRARLRRLRGRVESYWGTGRTEAFSDGVFAIAITLLILEVNVPETAFDNLWQGIADQWPSYLAYATSFITIGGIWLAHHGIFRRLQYANQRLMVINLLLLMVVSFLPFPTKLMAEAIHHSDAERAAVIFYGGTLLVISLAAQRPLGIGHTRPPPAPARGGRGRDQGDHAGRNTDHRLLHRRDRARLRGSRR